MTNDDVISAFVDGEDFDSRQLVDALAQPEGRELLLDIVALRAVVGDEPGSSDGAALVLREHRSRLGLWLVSAAAVLVCTIGGYVLGREQGVDAAAGWNAGAAPEPSVVLQFDDWQGDGNDSPNDGGL